MGIAQDTLPVTNHIYCIVGNEFVKPSKDSVAYAQFHGLLPTIWTYKGKTVYQYIDKSVDGKWVTRLCVIYKRRGKYRTKIL